MKPGSCPSNEQGFKLIPGEVRALHQDIDSDPLFGDSLQRAVSRFDCGKSSVIKQTLEMQSECTSATRDPLKEACLARGVSMNS